MVSGVAAVAKPRGPTSHDVVAQARRALGQRRVGHAGTLDPRAEGVLVLLIGSATRLAEFAVAGDKAYAFDVAFGLETDTLDLDGRVVRSEPCRSIEPGQLDRAIEHVRQMRAMVPPSVSALRLDGQRMYRRTRAGEVLELPPRPVTIHRLSFTGWREGPDEWLRGGFEVECSKGTYVRAIARELAHACGTVGSVDRLVRTRSGCFELDAAVPLERFLEACQSGRADEVLLPTAEAAADLPAVAMPGADDGLALCSGRRVLVGAASGCRPGPVRVYDAGGRFLAIAEAEVEGTGWALRPSRVLYDVRTQGLSAQDRGAE